MITQARKFNLSKKVAQLVKVTFFFAGQIEERRLQKEYLNKIFSEQIEGTLNESNDNVAKLIENNKDFESKCINNEKSKFEEKYKKLIENLKENEGNKIAEMNKLEQTIEKEVVELLKQIPEIKEKSETQQKEFISKYEKSRKKLEDRIKELNDVYKQEVADLSQKSEEKLAKYKLETREKFDKMHDDHTALLEQLMKGDNTPLFTDKQRENIEKQKKRIAELRDAMNPIYQELQLLKSTNQIRIRDNAAVVNKLRNQPPLTAGKNEEVEKKRKEFENLKDENSKILKEEEEKLAALKANLEYKYQKVKADVSEELNQLKQLFEDKKAEFGSLNSSSTKEIEELKKQLKNEFDEKKKTLEMKESEQTLKLNEREKENAKIKASAKEERKKLKKEFTKLKNDNQLKRDEYEAKLKGIVREKAEENVEEIKKMEVEIKNARNSNKSSLNDKFEMLEEEKRLKEEAERNRYSKIQETDEKNHKELSEIKEEFKKEIEEIKATLDKEFENATEKSKDKISNNENAMQRNLENLRKEKREQYTAEIEEIKKSFEDKTEYEETEAKFKEEFMKLNEIANGIDAPNLNGSESFKKLLDVIENMSNDINNLNGLIDLERKQNQTKFDDLIAAENERFSTAIRPKTSGRAREQLKSSYLHKIEACKESIEFEVKKLEEILRKIINDHKNSMDALHENKMEASSASYAEKLLKEIQNLNFEYEEETSRAKKEAEAKEDNSLKNIKMLHEQLNSSIAKLNDELTRPFTTMSLQREYAKVKKECSETIEEKEKEFSNAEKSLKTSNEMEKSMLMNDISHQKDKLSLSCGNFDKKMQSNRAKFESEIKTRRERKENELNKLKNDSAALIQFYDESIAVLIEKKSRLDKEFDFNAPRLCDVELISSLTAQLQSKAKMLKILAVDYGKYQQLLRQQERDFNKRFGNKLYIKK